MTTAGSFMKSIARLGVWKRGEERAPHKPLLLLWALANLQNGGPRLVEFNDLEGPVRALLDRYGHPRKRSHPEYPFWWLQTDGLWEVPGGNDLPRRGSGKEPRITVVRERRVTGGFPEDIEALLKRRPGLASRAARRLLLNHFPETLHGDVLAQVGLDLRVTGTRTSLARDPEFARRVLEAYENRCAMCGYRGVLEDRVVGLDAAHIHWHCRGGPSTLDNGMALCALHHRLFDHGAVGVAEDLTLLVSAKFMETGAPPARVEAGTPLLGPRKGLPGIAAGFREWHFKQVFREPAVAVG